MNKITEKTIESLDEILKCLFATLLNRYYTRFPTDAKDINRHKAGIVLNELVMEDLRRDQIEFRYANTEFVDSEKKEVMMFEEVKKGVLSFLVAKGGLYRLWRHPNADKWINEARKIEPEILIPTSLKEIQNVINCYLLWYQQRT